MAELGLPVRSRPDQGPRGLCRMISSLSLAQSPSKPGTATVQNHRFQWLQLPPAAPARTRARRSACGVPVRSPSRLAIATAGRRGHGPRRSAGDRWRGHAAPPRRARGPARRAQPTCCASSRQRGAGRAPPAAIAARPAGRGQSAVRRSAAGQLSPTAPAPTSSTSVASVTSPASPSSSSANSVATAAKSWPLPSRCATSYHSASGSLARARPARGHQPPSRAAHRAKVAGQIAQHPLR
jgi:hypothetical protein